MHYHSSLLLLGLLGASSATALQTRQSDCGDGYALIDSTTNGKEIKVCCPGVMKVDGATYCCIGGNSDCKAGEVTCFDDLSSCKSTVDVSDSNYVAEVKAATGEAPPSPDGSDSDSDSTTTQGATTSAPSSTTASGSAEATASAESTSTSAASATGTSSSSSSQTSVPANAGVRAVGSQALAMGLVGLFVAEGVVNAL